MLERAPVYDADRLGLENTRFHIGPQPRGDTSKSISLRQSWFSGGVHLARPASRGPEEGSGKVIKLHECGLGAVVVLTVLSVCAFYRQSDFVS